MGFNWDSKHFSVEKLSDGVYAAIHRNGGSAICNAGLIDLGGTIVVFDTFLTLKAARDLLSLSLGIFGRAPDIVVNSHYHNDHTWGNQIFAGNAEIISSAGTSRFFETEGKAEFDWYRANSADQLRALKTRYEISSDAEERKGLLLMLGYYEGLVDELPDLVPVRPDAAFSGSLMLHGKNRDAELREFDGCHTGSDAVLFLPRERILFTGDLLFVDSHPYLAEADPESLIGALRRISGWDASLFVPGHGGIGGREDLFSLIEYVEFCIAAATKAKHDGCNKESLLDVAIPDKFADWQMPHMLQSNLSAIYDRLNE